MATDEIVKATAARIGEDMRRVGLVGYNLTERQMERIVSVVLEAREKVPVHEAVRVSYHDFDPGYTCRCGGSGDRQWMMEHLGAEQTVASAVCEAAPGAPAVEEAAAAAGYLVRFKDGPLAGRDVSLPGVGFGGGWPLPPKLAVANLNSGGAPSIWDAAHTRDEGAPVAEWHYVKVRESKLEEDVAGVLRGAEYEVYDGG